MTTTTYPEILMLSVAAGAGLGVGFFFFGGLWWTVRKCLNSPNSALWLLMSFLLRVGVVLAGFYLLATTAFFQTSSINDSWQPLLLGLIGFVFARLLVTRLIRLSSAGQSAARLEARDAP